METDVITKFRMATVGVCITTEQSAAINLTVKERSGIFTIPVPKLGNTKANYIIEKSHKALE